MKKILLILLSMISINVYALEEPIDITSCNIEMDNSNYVYNGNEIKPNIKVICDTEELDSSNYEVTYENNINAGNANIIVNGINDYEGRLRDRRLEDNTRYPMIYYSIIKEEL